MRKRIFLLLTLAAICFLCACQIRTVDEMYQVPKRPESYNDLQRVMEASMSGMDYSAPKTGENQQTVQMADLDGDGIREYLLFAKSNGDKPLQILIFSQKDDSVVLTDTIACSGTSFDLVEYAQMDGTGGMEIVVGCQLSQQVTRSVSVYSFKGSTIEKITSANYIKFLTCDLDGDSQMELVVFNPSSEEEAYTVAERYYFSNGNIVCSSKVKMSAPTANLKRITAGALYGGVPGIFVASVVDANNVISDVLTLVNGQFKNVAAKSTQGLSNSHIFADDIEDDGELELPYLIPMRPVEQGDLIDTQYLIRWYSVDQRGREADKMFTYHDTSGGWYIKLDPAWANKISVCQKGDEFEFYLWDEDNHSAQKIFSIFAFTGQNREEQAVQDNRFTVYKNDSVIYAARLEVASGALRITQNDLIETFRLIQKDWKAGEI